MIKYAAIDAAQIILLHIFENAGNPENSII